MFFFSLCYLFLAAQNCLWEGASGAVRMASNWELKWGVGELAHFIRVFVIRPLHWEKVRPCRAVAARSCVTKIYANGPLHMLIPHIYIKVNRLLHCFLTPASIHDYLFRFLCKTPYKHGAGIFVNVSVGLFPVAAQGSHNCGWGLRHKRPHKEQGKPSLQCCNVPWLLNSPLELSPCYWQSALLMHQ